MWFIVHFWADLMFAIPLFTAPETVLALFGWQFVDPYSARLTAAALFGIGFESLRCRNASVDVFLGMLNLKVVWSGAAVLGIAWSLFEGVHGRPWATWAILFIFAAFHLLWRYWRLRLRKPRG